MQPKGKRRTAALLMAAVMVLVSAGSTVVFADDTASTASAASSSAKTTSKDNSNNYQDQLDKLNSQLSELAKQQQQLANQISQAKNEKERKEAEKRQLSTQIQVTQEQIRVMTERIELLTEQIDQKETEIALKSAEIESNYRVFKKRMRAMYMSGNASMMGLVLGADSYYQFLTRAEAVSRVSAHDQDLLDSLVEEKNDIDAARQQIEEYKADVESSKSEVEQKKAQLSTQMGQVQSQIQDISALEAEMRANEAEVKKKYAAIRAEIDKIYEQIKLEDSDYVGGEMLWPVAMTKQITSYFGWRWNNTDYHTGIDISCAGIYGADVRAANSGKVTYVGWQANGYGNYVIVDHGGGTTTLYAHCSSILVSVGQTVARGETIAKVGSTGWSTGPHLHFEVRENKVAKNPLAYVK